MLAPTQQDVPTLSTSSLKDLAEIFDDASVLHICRNADEISWGTVEENLTFARTADDQDMTARWASLPRHAIELALTTLVRSLGYTGNGPEKWPASLQKAARSGREMVRLLESAPAEEELSKIVYRALGWMPPVGTLSNAFVDDVRSPRLLFRHPEQFSV